MKRKIFILTSLAVASGVFVFVLLRSYLRADRNLPPVEPGLREQDDCGARREFFAGTRHTYINLRNVKFHWTGDYFIRTEDADIKVAPRGGDRVFNLDDSSSYVLQIIRGAVDGGAPGAGEALQRADAELSRRGAEKHQAHRGRAGGR